MTGNGVVLGFGHPLLDITADVNQEFLERFNLAPNDAILGGDEQATLINELIERFPVRYSAGGSTQNAIRVAQWILSKPRSAAFLGTIGSDAEGRLLTQRAQGDGLEVLYVIDKSKPTGVCAVLLTDGGQKRSLVSFLGAATVCNKPHIMQHWEAVERAQIYYAAGFSIRTGYDAVLLMAEHAAQAVGKTFAINLSAPYVCQHLSDQLMELLPLVDIVFGNEEEALALGKALNWQTEDVSQVVLRLSALPSKKNDLGRLAVITRGATPVLVGRAGSLTNYRVPYIAKESIVDTNGAGDAFVGGFLGTLALGKPIDNCIQTGIACAGKIIQITGCNLAAFSNA